MREVVEVIVISNVSIFNDYMGMTKLSTKWVPRLLIIYQKCNHAIISLLFSFCCSATIRTNLCGVFKPETKHGFTIINWDLNNSQNNEVSRGKSGLKNAKGDLSANNVMATVIWDA